jgi:hypothetical protein
MEKVIDQDLLIKFKTVARVLKPTCCESLWICFIIGGKSPTRNPSARKNKPPWKKDERPCDGEISHILSLGRKLKRNWAYELWPGP